jgi:hypothetical protein
MNGLGDSNAAFRVYMKNTPPVLPYNESHCVLPLGTGEIARIGQECGNGWRKVFNVYAKLLYAWQWSGLKILPNITCWQGYRDKQLLQADSNTQLTFVDEHQTVPYVTSSCPSGQVNIDLVMGKLFALKQPFAEHLIWHDEYFAELPGSSLLVCPYFDYRQLTNARLEKLTTKLQSMIL